MNLLDNIDNTIPFIGKTWWTNFDNPMAVWFYEIHQNNLIYGNFLLDEKYLCAILEGDWKWIKVKTLLNRWK